jgi:hypothetical protein
MLSSAAAVGIGFERKTKALIATALAAFGASSATGPGDANRRALDSSHLFSAARGGPIVNRAALVERARSIEMAGGCTPCEMIDKAAFELTPNATRVTASAIGHTSQRASEIGRTIFALSRQFARDRSCRGQLLFLNYSTQMTVRLPASISTGRSST